MIRSYSIRELLVAVRRLPAAMPQSDRLLESGYDTHKDRWIGWLESADNHDSSALGEKLVTFPAKSEASH
jgi:hypothetical protein